MCVGFHAARMEYQHDPYPKIDDKGLPFYAQTDECIHENMQSNMNAEQDWVCPYLTLFNSI